MRNPDATQGKGSMVKYLIEGYSFLRRAIAGHFAALGCNRERRLFFCHAVFVEKFINRQAQDGSHLLPHRDRCPGKTVANVVELRPIPPDKQMQRMDRHLPLPQNRFNIRLHIFTPSFDRPANFHL